MSEQRWRPTTPDINHVQRTFEIPPQSQVFQPPFLIKLAQFEIACWDSQTPSLNFQLQCPFQVGLQPQKVGAVLE